MWMVGCSNGSELNMSADSFNGRKLRPLIPRPTSKSPKTAINSAITNNPYLSCIHGADLFAFNHRLATGTEQSKRYLDQPPLVSSRWNPTPEQLQALEDMYRRGTRTPSAEQIQHIAAQLRRFGKIEGKNVFYWFQNHKARLRQKRRRQSDPASEEQQGDSTESPERKYSGLRRTAGFEVEETNNWPTPSNGSTLSEESVSIHRVTDGWIQFEERELQKRRDKVERHATWQKMELSACSPLTYLINTIPTTTEAGAWRHLDPKQLNFNQNHSTCKLFEKPNRENFTNPEDEIRETQTLRLFPIRGDDHHIHSGKSTTTVNEKEYSTVSITTIDTNFTPYQFFEFLPLKN